MTKYRVTFQKGNIPPHSLGHANNPHPAGTAMSGLTPLQQRFCEAMVDYPLLSNPAALRHAGYRGSDSACRKMVQRLIHNAAFLEAVKEVARARMEGLAPMAIHSLGELVKNPKHPKHMQAIDSLLNRAGFAPVVKTEQTTTIKHEINPDAMIAKIAAILQRNQTLLTQVVPVKDGDTVLAIGEQHETD